jgi:hypothetical protein
MDISAMHAGWALRLVPGIGMGHERIGIDEFI